MKNAGTLLVDIIWRSFELKLRTYRLGRGEYRNHTEGDEQRSSPLFEGMQTNKSHLIPSEDVQ